MNHIVYFKHIFASFDFIKSVWLIYIILLSRVTEYWIISSLLFLHRAFGKQCLLTFLLFDAADSRWKNYVCLFSCQSSCYPTHNNVNKFDCFGSRFYSGSWWKVKMLNGSRQAAGQEQNRSEKNHMNTILSSGDFIKEILSSCGVSTMKLHSLYVTNDIFRNA